MQINLPILNYYFITFQHEDKYDLKKDLIQN